MTEPKTPPPGTDGTSELPEEIRRRVDALDARLATLDFYSILGLPRTATRAQIRSALLSVAPMFHPDRYFGKKIGETYKVRMQRVYARMALAHDTLIDDERRAAYDRALPPPLPEAAPQPAPPPARQAPPPLPQSDASPPSSRRMPAADADADAGPRSSQMRTPAASSPEFDRSRAQAFATRLAGSSRMRAATPVQAFHPQGTPGQPPRRPSSATMPAVDPKAAVDSLRRRYEESVARAQNKQKSSHVQAAEQASARGDHAEASRLYRVALEHSSDPSMKAVLVQAEQREKEQTRSTAIATAKELEQKQDYMQAGIEWARAFDAAPTAEAANRAALCFRRAGTDLRKAAKYGEEAVKIDPNKASYRVTLALAYADAGLVLRARGEIERAMALEPQNANVKEAAQKIKSMG